MRDRPSVLRPWIARTQDWCAGSRLATALLAVLFEAYTGVTWRFVLATGFLVLQILTQSVDRRTRHGAWFDIVLAAVLLALTGDPVGAYTPFALVASVEAGLFLGMRSGIASGALVALAGTWSVMSLGAGFARQIAWLALFPLVGATGALVSRAWGSGHQELERLLRQTNSLLSDFHEFALAAPPGLDPRRIADHIAERIAAVTGAQSVRVLELEERDANLAAWRGDAPFATVASREDVDALTANGVRYIAEDDMPVSVQDLLGRAPYWLVLPILGDRAVRGAAFVSAQVTDDHAAEHGDLTRISDLAAVGLENAMLFRRLRGIVIDEERRRLVRDLHDGPAQTLSHLRLDLELLARARDLTLGDLQTTVGELAETANRVLDELRSMIRGLRATAAEDGLVSALRNHVRACGAAGPSVRFIADVEPALPELVEQEMYLIAQEAISNARRHADANHVVVSLRLESGDLTLSVHDDGHGLREPSDDPGSGQGLAIMHERAYGIGAALSVRERPDGTDVTVRVPLARHVAVRRPVRTHIDLATAEGRA